MSEVCQLCKCANCSGHIACDRCGDMLPNLYDMHVCKPVEVKAEVKAEVVVEAPAEIAPVQEAPAEVVAEEVAVDAMPVVAEPAKKKSKA